MNAPGGGWLRWLAVAIFGTMAVSDVLDGYLARRLGGESPLGRFLDPLADKLLITVAVLILCVVGIRDLSDPTATLSLRLPIWVAVTAVGKDLVVSLGFAAVYFTTGRVLIRPRLFGKCCTVIQLLMVLSVLLWIDVPVWLSGLPEVLWYLATALAVAAALDYVRLGSQFVAGVAAENARGSKGDQVDVGEGR
jgi:phosphatidylglycerophosphate synthase